MLKKSAIIVGAVFLLIGLLGFVPAASPKDANGMPLLLNFFMVGDIHNIVHIISGTLALASSLSEKYTKAYFQVFGIVYLAVTLAGFIQKDTVLSLFHVNAADNFLHLVLAVAFIGLGFGAKTDDSSTPARP